VPQKMAIATEVLAEVDRNPALKDRLLSSLREAGTTAIEKSLEKVTDSIVVSTLVAGLKGFLESFKTVMPSASRVADQSCHSP
jgi:hypothetical protein